MAEQTKRQPGPATKGYELAEPPPKTIPRRDLERIQRPARWCPACGYDLTLVNEPPCPRCERPFIPGDTATYATEPVEVRHRYWTDRPRIAGYFMLPLFLVGRAVVNNIAPEWVNWMDGSGGNAGVVFGAMVGLLLIPWLIATTLLGTIALDDYYNPKTLYCMLVGAGFGVVITLGMSPVLLLAGIFAGLFAGFIRAWLAKM